jgi:hypothetical protein
VVVPAPSSGPTEPPAPLPAAPTSEIDPFVGRLVTPVGLIAALVLAGFLIAKVKGRSPAAAAAAASSGPAASPAGGAAAAAGAAAADESSLEPELYSALADPVAPFLEEVPHATDAAGWVPAPAQPANGGPDPWASVRTIAIHVEQIEAREDQPGQN